MKKLLALLFVIMSIVSHAQFNKGDKFVGGYSGFDSHRATYVTNNGAVTKSTSVSVIPTIGFFINKNIAIGGSVGYNSSYSKYTDGINSTPYTNKQTGQSLSSGVFIKRFLTISDKFLFALKGSVYYARGTTTYESGPNKTKHKDYGVNASVSPSFIFFPTSKWGIEASLGSLSYDHSKNITDDSKHDSFGFSLGTFSLGFSYYLRKNVE
jgi:hypothetical protein